MAFLLDKYPKGTLSLDVNAENEKAIRFYRGLGLIERETYRVMDK
jgi:ribosomal protein S18 acetylase RimI-like enzyme